MGREVKNRKTGRCAEGRAHGAEIEMMKKNGGGVRRFF